MKVLHIASHNSLTRGGAVQLIRMLKGQSILGLCGSVIFNKKNCADLPPKIGNFQIFCHNLSALNLLKILKTSKNHDIIHAHKPEALKAAVLPHILIKKPLIFQRGTTYPVKGITRWMLKTFPIVNIAVSHAVKCSLIKAGISEKKIRVVYGSAEEMEMRKEKGTYYRFGIVAALTGKKGYPLFFSIAKNIARMIKAKFYVFGSGKKEKFKEYYLDIEKFVRFMGYVNDVGKIYSKLDMLLCTSTKGEGFTGSVREAMLYEISVASTAVSGNPEFVDNGKTGIIIDFHPEDSSAKLLKVILNPKITHKFKKNAKKLALKFFTINRQSKRLNAIYKKLREMQ